jgi:ERCC4-type nuclease
MIKEIYIDTREQVFKHISNFFQLKEIPIKRAKLDFGDYSFRTQSQDYRNIFAIERKHSLDELAINFTKHRETFKKEFIRANEVGAKILLLIEDSNQEMIKNHYYRSQFHPNAFMGSLNSWHYKYNIDIFFCKSKYTGENILKLFNNFVDKIESS